MQHAANFQLLRGMLTLLSAVVIQTLQTTSLLITMLASYAGDKGQLVLYQYFTIVFSTFLLKLIYVLILIFAYTVIIKLESSI